MVKDILEIDGMPVDEWGRPYAPSAPYAPIVHCMVCGAVMTEHNTVDPFVVDCCEDCFFAE